MLSLGHGSLVRRANRFHSIFFTLPHVSAVGNLAVGHKSCLTVLLQHESLLRFVSHEKGLDFDEICLVVTVILDLRPQGWVQDLRRVKGPDLLLSLDDLGVEHSEMTLSGPAHPRPRLVPLELDHLGRITDFHLKYVAVLVTVGVIILALALSALVRFLPQLACVVA